MQTKGLLRIALLALLVLLVQGTWVLAGTTGNVEGRVTDQGGNGVTGAKVTVASPSQSVTITSGANGFYAALNLSPDTYSVTASKDGYDTSTVYGVTVVADQSASADVKMRQTVKTIGHITTTATATVVSKTITGDLYAVNATAIQNSQGASGGAETLYSQNGVVGTLPGVNRYAIGSGPGYGGQGQLSIRGGAPDQVGYELDGIPLNRGFDFYNGTAFSTNGLASLEVYTGGAPADSGRAMSGYINEIIARGKYPGGADFTGVVGAPLFNHSVQADVYGGTPDNRFTYYVSTLATNNYVNFGDRSNLANTSFTVPAGDPGCGQFNYGPIQLFGVSIVQATASGNNFLNCSQSYTLNQPASQGAYGSTPFNAGRDTAANLHWGFLHNGLNDDLQALYVIGTTVAAPYGPYGVFGADPAQTTEFDTGTTVSPAGRIQWPTGAFYQGQVGQPYSQANLLPLSWPTSGGSVTTCPGVGFNGATGLPFCGGDMPPTFQDSESTQYSIEKLAYTHSLTQSSFLRVYGYQMYSSWTLDQPINGFIGFSFYQLHDNATGAGLDYQNQLNQQNLLKLIGDWTRDKTLRYNYAPESVAPPSCVGGCAPGAQVTAIGIPFSTWNTVTPLDWDGVIQDTFKPSDKVQFDLGLRWDQFGFQLMPQKITGPDGLAYLSEEVDGICLQGFNYSASDPMIIGPLGKDNCRSYLINGFNDLPGYPESLAGNTKILPGAFGWTNPPTFASFTTLSPRFGATFTLSPRDVIRLSAGRYVQPPNSAFEQYTRNPRWGPGAGTSLLNSFMTGLGFGAYHDILPEDSTNYDLSIEHEFSGGVSTKITPFYRNTRNQILSIPFNPASPSFVTGDNFGNSRIKGVEFTLQRRVAEASGIGATLNATYTDTKIRFNVPRGGTTSFIDVLNGTNAAGVCQGGGICGYNTAYNTNYALLDPNGYYSPSFVMSPTSTGPSYDVRWNVNFTPEIKEAGFDVFIPFLYVSGSPYGDAFQFGDPHCPPGVTANASTGCIAVPSGINPKTGAAYAYYGGNGPDPYTRTFDGPGSLTGPSYWTLSFAVTHDIGHNLKASILGSNLLTGVHNHGYPWEQPTAQNNVSYGDNAFYSVFPLGAFTGFNGPGANVPPNPATGYYGNNYYPYASSGILPYRDFVFSVTAKI